MPAQQEASKLYNEILKKLHDMGADDLRYEIQNTVARGRATERQIRHEKAYAAQEPLTPLDALLVAIRMITASIDPIFSLDDARKEVCLKYEDATPTIVWRFDSLEGVRHETTGGSRRPSDSPSAEEIRSPTPNTPQSYDANELTRILSTIPVAELEKMLKLSIEVKQICYGISQEVD